METIVPFFTKHPLQGNTKRKSFGLFCEIAKLVGSGAHHAGTGLELIRALKAQMNHRTRVTREIRTLRGNTKYQLS